MLRYEKKGGEEVCECVRVEEGRRVDEVRGYEIGKDQEDRREKARVSNVRYRYEEMGVRVSSGKQGGLATKR